MKDLVLYIRTSQLDQNSSTQQVYLEDYCKRMQYKIKDEYIDDGFSGKDDKRPEFERLITDVRDGRVKCILVYKLDRIGRSLKHLLNLFEEFKNRKVEFISATQNINTNTPEGELFWKLLGIFAEYERSLIIARTNAGLARARKQGKTLGRPKGSKDKKRRRISGYIRRWTK